MRGKTWRGPASAVSARGRPLVRGRVLPNLAETCSLVPQLPSKIFEKIMYRIIEFINKHDILYKYQFGFRGGMGTNTAMIILIDKIVSALDNGDSVIGVFLYFSKAFDTVDHTILLKKTTQIRNYRFSKRLDKKLLN